MKTESTDFLLRREHDLRTEYSRIVEEQTIDLDGTRISAVSWQPALDLPSRKQRERVWRLCADRLAADGAVLDRVWAELIELRCRIAQDRGVADYTSLRVHESSEVEIASSDCFRRLHAVEEWVSSAVVRLHEERRQTLGVRSLRPWDIEIDPLVEWGAGTDTAPDIQPLSLGLNRRGDLQATLLRCLVAAMADSLQHWVYAHPEEAVIPSAMAAQWSDLWLQFLPGVDCHGLENEMGREWQRHSEIFLFPFASHSSESIIPRTEHDVRDFAEFIQDQL